MTTQRKKPPCRLNVILARTAPLAVVFRRGPSQWVQLIRWNTNTDELEPGQWFHGRIYAGRCDPSPDGSKLVYFAAKHWQWQDEEFGAAWTAISRPPYFTALSLWPRNIGTWYGGGLFRAERNLVLNGPSEVAPHAEFQPPPELDVSWQPLALGEELAGIRLARDGWEVTHHVRPYGYLPDGTVTQTRAWQSGDRLLRAVETCTRSQLRETYELVDVPTQRSVELPALTWAGWDRCGRLLCARAGALCEVEWTGGEVRYREIANFNASGPEPLEPPPWAKAWPTS